jgi:hypothetical protein
MKQLRLLVFVLCLALLPLAAPAQDAKPKMEIPQSTFDAGSLYRSDKKIEHAFVIKNTGAVELKILRAQPG